MTISSTISAKENYKTGIVSNEGTFVTTVYGLKIAQCQWNTAFLCKSINVYCAYSKS